MADLISNSKNYQDLLARLKSQIRTAQVRAAMAVNQELVLLYWGIGKEILSRQSEEGWGTKVVERLAHDLHVEFPNMGGLSSRNLKYMRAFAEAWPIVQQPVAQLPWGHKLPSGRSQPYWDAWRELLGRPHLRFWTSLSSQANE